MIGVVVWTDQTFEKAVIWCEDQSDLAYFVRPDQEFFENNKMTAGEISAPLDDIRKGDLVVFDAYYEGDCRMAKNLRLLEEDSHPLLADYLQPDANSDQGGQTAAVASDHLAQDQVKTTGEILPFLGGNNGRVGHQVQPNRRKSG
ncbi:hypothetical protein TRM7557_03002 [Tritonibacter multivorans]|uniref:Uncharacterized protein n=3 Tax=Tritonibacter multivorans TaxID=928856 RepID=A0A0P1GWJ2_9RHOB|nr:hypothetical protein TRM7557_03002 [Tritonibacter multivorans]SFC84147.1 hypothetical protein SAMN04488049_104285 [Tritonibacter multivorans]